MKKLICVDFDGVLHSYTSGWQGPHMASDPPVPGAMEWLEDMATDDRFEINIYSSRSKEIGGVDTIKRWLLRHGLSETAFLRIKFPTQKPAAHLMIDDRAFLFEGSFPSTELILDFKPWNKRNRTAGGENA